LLFREATLSNGLEIIAECNDRAYSTAIGFFVKAGSRDESPELAGVSHFLEHMAFKGTPRRSAADVNRELDEIGSHSNAYTSEEQTVYYATVLPEYQGVAVDLLADIMRPSLRADDFETEKQVIIEEILKYDDQPPFGAHEKCMKAHFANHPLGHSVLGTVDTVSALTPEAMRSYFQNRYSPANIVLTAAGKIDFERLVVMAQQLCGSWQPFEARRQYLPAPGATDFRIITKPAATQQYLVQISAGPGATDEDRFASRILAAIVGDDSGSRMYWELVDTGLAEFACLGAQEFHGAGILMTYMCCGPEDAAGNLERIQSIQHQIERSGVTEDELSLAKSKMCSHLVRQSERPTNRLFSVGTGWIQRRQYSTTQERLASYQRVTRDDIHRVIETYPLSKTTSVLIGPLEKLSGKSRRFV
jgi:predicted Zn-dependent peptidase